MSDEINNPEEENKLTEDLLTRSKKLREQSSSTNKRLQKVIAASNKMLHPNKSENLDESSESKSGLN